MDVKPHKKFIKIMKTQRKSLSWVSLANNVIALEFVKEERYVTETRWTNH